MPAILDLSDLVNLTTGGGAGGQVAPVQFWKDNRVGGLSAVTATGRFTSLWQYNGSPSGGGTPPTTAAVPDNTTPGGLQQLNPSGGRQKWLTGCAAVSGQAGTLILYDRLLHISGKSGTVTTAQTVGGALTRYNNSSTCIGNEIWIEINSAIGGSGTTITASYTNQAGNAATSPAVGIGGVGFNEVQRMIPLTLASGDKGVQACASVTLAGSTGAAGDFGVVIARRLLTIPAPLYAVGTLRSLMLEPPGAVEITSGACLAWIFMASGTAAPQIMGMLSFVEK